MNLRIDCVSNKNGNVEYSVKSNGERERKRERERERERGGEQEREPFQATVGQAHQKMKNFKLFAQLNQEKIQAENIFFFSRCKSVHAPTYVLYCIILAVYSIFRSSISIRKLT